MQPACLSNTNKTRHDEIVSATEDAIEKLFAQSKNISFYSVAKEAGVARSTLYRRDDLRKLVEDARNRDASQNLNIPSRTELLGRITELESELERAKRKIREAQRLRSLSLPRYTFIRFGEAA